PPTVCVRAGHAPWLAYRRVVAVRWPVTAMVARTAATIPAGER
ncbi:MAG: hypothetical protein QOI10_3739, partial [Solirubrobacterales bacterium]|nr:hypothetical protein [Solirubrobacterales bacterium]